jgi:hypothetical protein
MSKHNRLKPVGQAKDEPVDQVLSKLQCNAKRGIAYGWFVDAITRRKRRRNSLSVDGQDACELGIKQAFVVVLSVLIQL